MRRTAYALGLGQLFAGLLAAAGPALERSAEGVARYPEGGVKLAFDGRELAGRWLLSTALGLGIGLAAGVVLLEVVGELLTGHPMRLLQQEPLPRALSFLILGAISGLCLGFAQRLMLRRAPRLPSHWPLLSACGLGLGFPAGSLLADTVLSGLTSPAGLLELVVVSGAVLGSFTARPVVRAAV